MRIAVYFLGLILLVGCQAFEGFPSEAGPSAEVKATAAADHLSASPASSPSPAPVAAPAHANDLELKFAKLWARVDELENQHIQQKERMKLIEKGLLLGIIPDELKGPPKKAPRTQGEASPDLHSEHSAETEVPPKENSKAPIPAQSAEKSQDISAYKQLLQQAQGKFNAAQYGQAIVHFNEIGERFDDSITEGSQNYWIGLSWFYLKEYQLAEQSFKTLRERHSENSWVPHARYYQAKIDQVRGLSKRALEQFSQLMEEFASQDLGEMARMEVARMKEKL